MKFDAPPERIWLQLHGDCEPEYPVECDESVTWCWESIFPSDTEYVRADIAEQMVKDAREKCAVLVWMHYMDVCKSRELSPSEHEDWNAARTIRETIK